MAQLHSSYSYKKKRKKNSWTLKQCQNRLKQRSNRIDMEHLDISSLGQTLGLQEQKTFG